MVQGNSAIRYLVQTFDSTPEPYIGCPCPPMPMGFGWAWVRYYCSWVGMCGHVWALVLCIRASSSKSESNFLDAWNTLTKKRSGLKLRQWMTFYLSDPTKTWCRRVMYIPQILNTRAQFEYHGWTWVGTCHAMGGAWVGIGRCWWLWSGYGYKFKGKCWALLAMATKPQSNIHSMIQT